MTRFLELLILAISFLGMLEKVRAQNITNATTDDIPDMPPPGVPPGIPPEMPIGQNNTQAPTVTEEGCYATTDDIFILISDDDKVFSPKRYVLCPNTVIDIGYLEFGVGFSGGQAPLIPRSNTEFLCGEDGKPENNCVIKGGDFGVLGIPVIFPQDNSLNNVVIRGFTFEGQAQYSIFVGTTGNIRLEDCIFRNSANFGPIWLAHDPDVVLSDRSLQKYEKHDNPWDAASEYIKDTIEYYDSKRKSRLVEAWDEMGEVGKEGSLVSGHGGQRTLQTDLLKGAVINCKFQGLQQIERAPGVSPGILTVLGPGSDVEVRGCIFANNKYGDEKLSPRGYAILAHEVVISIQDCCFINNDFRGFAPIILEMTGDPSTILEGNYATTGDDALDCPLAAYFETEEDRLNFDYECVGTLVDECAGELLIPTSENGDYTSPPAMAPAPTPQSTSGKSGLSFGHSITLIFFAGISCLVVGL